MCVSTLRLVRSSRLMMIWEGVSEVGRLAEQEATPSSQRNSNPPLSSP
jgi:hypothetical protein